MFRVKVSSQFLEAVTLAAIEAYCYGDKPGRRWRPVETLGYIWGFKKTIGSETVLFLDRMSISISSTRGRDSVDPNPEAAVLKNEVVLRWSPHVALLGDFHSHPYRTLKDVNAINGFEFSARDFAAFVDDDFIWEQSGNNPVMVAITICRLGRVRENFGERIRSNVHRYKIGQFQFWINVAVGYLDEAGNRCHTGNSHSKAILDLDQWLYNPASDRVAEYMTPPAPHVLAQARRHRERNRPTRTKKSRR
jgi:hypothetical protein